MSYAYYFDQNEVHNMHLFIHPKPNQKLQISNSKLDKTKRSTKGVITKDMTMIMGGEDHMAIE